MGLALAAVVRERAAGPWPRRHPAAGRGRIRSGRARICGARHGRHGRRVRRRAGAPFRSYPSRQRASPAIAVRHRHTRAGTAAQRLGGRAARARADAADRRRRAAGELPSVAASGSRVSRRRCPHVRREPSERPVRCGATRRLSRGAGPPSSDYSRCDRSGRDLVPSGDRKLSRLEYLHLQRSASRDIGEPAETDSTSSSAPSAEMSSRRWRFRCWQAAPSMRATTAARRRARW